MARELAIVAGMKTSLVTTLSIGLGLGMACGGDSNSTADAGLTPDSGEQVVRPGKRSDSGGVFDPQTGLFAIFGGDDGPIVNQIPRARYLNDTWVFGPTAGWSEVSGAGPSARGRQAVAYDPSGRMLLFGGRFRAAGQSGNYTLFNDLWAFDFAAKSWTEVTATGTLPTPRYFAAAAFSSTDGLLVYGGGINTSALNLTPVDDVWRFKDGAWTEVQVSGSAPSKRLFVAYTHDSMRNRLIIFGGQVGDFVSPALNDLFALDMTTGEWTRLADGMGTAPSGRFSSSMTYDADTDRYLLLGGHADPGVTNDAWAFDPKTNTWSTLRSADTFTGGTLGCMGNPRELPKGYITEDLSAPERRSGGILFMAGTETWLFGGESDCSDHLDDLWRISSAGEWTEVLEARSGESCGRRGDDCQCLCL